MNIAGAARDWPALEAILKLRALQADGDFDQYRTTTSTKNNATSTKAAGTTTSRRPFHDPGPRSLQPTMAIKATTSCRSWMCTRARRTRRSSIWAAASCRCAGWWARRRRWSRSWSGLPRPSVAVCEAGPTGFGLVRAGRERGIDVRVIAPGSIPKGPGDRVKTDRRDAIRLVQAAGAPASCGSRSCRASRMRRSETWSAASRMCAAI